ncbi:MAG: T9SS type A sorting domain-containing protein [candidate division Zixibacteria bacterium]|nr:T9SS type A sorting domain-containing protein [candidate division Zixibacteria bacterium]
MIIYKSVRWKPPGLITKPILFALILIMLFSTNTLAQSSSASYSLSGGTVGGGGISGSSGYNIVGNVPLMAGGLSSSGSYQMTGGTISHLATATLAVNYAGSSLQTVSVANRTMTVTYTGGSGTAVSGLFFYRQGGTSSFTQTAMTDNGAGTLTYTLNASLLGVRGLEYFFVIAQDTYSTTIGTSFSPYVLRVRVNNAQGMRPTAMPDAQYRIIGLPLNPTSSSASTVFVDDLGAADDKVWRLGSYNNDSGTVTEFPAVAAVSPGQGYWLIARGGLRYGSAGTSLRPNYIYGGNQYYPVALDSGWNMVANPCPFNVAFSQVFVLYSGTVSTDHPAGLMDDAAHYYNGTGYQNVTVIPAWEGVFIHANRPNVSLLFRYQEAVSKSAYKPLASNLEADEWYLDITMRTGELEDGGNLIGVRQEAIEGADRYDISEPPPAPDGASLAFRIPGESSRLRKTDFRPHFEDGATWHIEMSFAKNRILSFNGLEKIVENWEAVLEMDNKSTFYLTPGQQITVPDNVSSARLIIGSKQYLTNEQVALPDDFVLDQNYPNPFNPMTNIHFTVPQQAHIRIEVHNILGQQVKLLLDENMPKGDYTITWEGKDQYNQPVASGIYFYRLTADSFSQCRKMVLLK